MDAYDSSGRRISLLSNDEEYSFTNTPYSANVAAEYTYNSSASAVPAYAPGTPELVRSHSIGSQSSHPETPSMTETTSFIYRRTSDQSRPDYEMSDAMPANQFHDQNKTLPALQSHFGAQQTSFGSQQTTVNAQKPQPNDDALTPPPVQKKLFACRLAKEYKCDKYFTTSGHASRHAKIHSQLKHIRCTFEGCPKTFTRTDNMKQHLETHNRGKEGKNGSKHGGDKPRRPTSRRRSDVSSRSNQASSRSVSTTSQQHSPYPVFSDIEYRRPELTHRASFDRSSGTGMDILAIAAEQAASVNE